MKKLVITFISISVGASLLLAAKSASTPVQENTGEGFYLGAGFGASLYNMTLAKSEYKLDDGTYTFDTADLNENDTGYLFYAGYQINKIIGVEASYTNYGTFSKDKFAKTYSQTPKSIAAYANAGYTFLNGQLRPFGLLGLGYLQKNQSKDYKDILDIKDDIVTVHYGMGVEYYPTVLKGLGFRASYTGDSHAQGNYDASDNNTTQSTSLWQNYGLFYIGAQYKF